MPGNSRSKFRFLSTPVTTLNLCSFSKPKLQMMAISRFIFLTDRIIVCFINSHKLFSALDYLFLIYEIKLLLILFYLFIYLFILKCMEVFTTNPLLTVDLTAVK